MNRLLSILVILFIGCSAPTITSNCDDTVDFNLYKTFSFAAYVPGSIPAHPEYNNPENRQILKQAIANELIKIGYTEVENSSDLLVEFDLIITEMIDTRVDSAVIYKPWVDTKIDSFNYTEGLLVIRIVDISQGVLVWQGSLSGILNKKPKKFGNRVDNYMTKLFSTLAERIQ
jgi:uncharacterized protein DUF4136